MRWKRLFYYLIINILVSACTVLSVLYAWERWRPQPEIATLLQIQTEIAPPTTPPAQQGTPPLETPQATRPEYDTHIVEAGETLSGIALLYDVSIDDLLLLNNLADPDSLDVGDVLLIPRPGEAVVAPTATERPPTRTPVPAPTLEDEGTATPAPGEPELQILTVIGAGELQDERVVIRQNGEGLVALQGWTLADSDGNVFVFPQVSLFKDGAITVYTRAGTSSVVELYWGLTEAIWESGEVVALADPDGNIVAAFQVP
jgi:LysM repeat protein